MCMKSYQSVPSYQFNREGRYYLFVFPSPAVINYLDSRRMTTTITYGILKTKFSYRFISTPFSKTSFALSTISVASMVMGKNLLPQGLSTLVSLMKYLHKLRSYTSIPYKYSKASITFAFCPGKSVYISLIVGTRFCTNQLNIFFVDQCLTVETLSHRDAAFLLSFTTEYVSE